MYTLEDELGSVRGYAIPPYIADFQQVHSYAEIQEVMRSPDFQQGGTPERFKFLGNSLLMTDGDEHLERKKRFSPLFSKEAMAYYEDHLLQPVIDEVMAELSVKRDEDGLVRGDFVPLIRMMLHRIGARVVGLDGVDTPARTERYRALISKLGEAATAQWTTRNLPELVQEGTDHMKMLVDEFLRPARDRRRDLVRRFNAGELTKDELPRDLLTAICLYGDDVRPGETEYDAYVWRECLFFSLGATQTTTHTLPHVIIHITEWLRDHPEDAEKVRDPEFLRLAVAESLRLHQTAPIKFRIASKDVTLSTGRKITEGEMVALFAPPANQDEALFGPDAKSFNLYRETPPGMLPWGLTFGAGAHMCLGRSLVTGLQGRRGEVGTEGTMVKILKVLYAYGVELDPDRRPRRTTVSYHDAYSTVPIILRKL
jgi:cytochrome P450